jgi:hypothetical protein
MKTAAFLLATLVAALCISSCKKEDETSTENKDKAEQFKASIVSKKYQVKEYYSDKPIDYNEDDEEVKAETDLFSYVSPWIKDDWNVFDVSSGKVAITQNEHKIPGDSTAVLSKDFSVSGEEEGVFFNFLNYQYEPLKYHLVEFTNDYFIVYADWHSGARVYTKFVVVP